MKAVTGLVRLVERVVALSAVMAEGVAAYGGEVTAERAVNATSAWIARSHAPSRLPTGEVRTFSMNGTNAFHLVALRGGGWVAMPADDAFEPVIAFNSDADVTIPEDDDGDPGWDALAGYVGMGAFGEDEIEVMGINDRPRFCVSAVDVSVSSVSSALPKLLSSKPDVAKGLTWESLDADSVGAAVWKRPQFKTVVQYSGTPADVRVPYLTKTKWGQKTYDNKANSEANYCYNYYTPNHWVCGCVATDMAQVMYYFKWPHTPMPEGTFKVYVGGETTYFPMERGSTGCFRWDSMTVKPTDSNSHSEENRKAIGMLTYNCGLSVGMKYNGGASASNTGKIAAALTNSFDYSSADHVTTGNYDDFNKAMLPNLDAAMPCAAGIAGHSVVADGYAFSEGCLFVHLNMGWRGSSDAYYRQMLPGHKRRVTHFVCNISTNDIPRFATGRITDAYGSPVADAQVTASILKNGESSATEQVVYTDAYGIYAVRVQSANCSISLSASKDGSVSLQNIRETAVTSAATGSSWGNDFVLVATNDTFTWTGGGNGTTLGDVNNWNRGIAPTNGATLVFGAAAPAFVTNDIPSFAPASVVFSPECPGIEVGGLGFYGVGAMASSAPERPVIVTETVFADTINVSGEIDFSGGVWGTCPVNHGVFYGDYHLTTENWWHPPARATVPAGSALYVKNYEGASPESLVIEAGGEVVVDYAKISGVQGYLLTRNQGKFTARYGLSAESTEFDRLVSTSYEDDNGVFVLYSLSGPNDVPKYLPPNFTYIIGKGGISGSLWRSYRDYSINLSPSANYAITGTIGDYANNSSANPLVFSLDDGCTGNPCTVTVSGTGALVGGTLQVHATGSGVFRIANDRCTFGGGLFVENCATLELAPSCSPGGGNLTFYGGTTLALPSSRDSVALVRGTIAVAVENTENVRLRFGDGTEPVPMGKYSIFYAAGGVSQSVEDAFALVNPVESGATARFEIADSKVLVLVVERDGEESPWVPLRDGIWTGNGGDGRFSNPANWLGGSVPENDGSLVLSVVSDATLVCDIPCFAPRSIAFSGASARIAISAADGGSITNIERLANAAVGIHHVFNLPVSFKDGEAADVTLDADCYMDFAGGMTAYTVKKTDGDVYYCGNVTLTKEGEDWSPALKDFAHILEGSMLSLHSITNSGDANFRIETGAKVKICGDYTLVLPPEEEDVEQEVENRFVTSYNAGTLEVTGRIIASGMCRLTASYWKADGMIIANGILCSAIGDVFCLNGDVKESVSSRWVVGADGLEATSLGFWVLAKSGTTVALLPKADYSINANMGVRKPLTIGTTDYFDDRVARTVTINGNLYRDSSVAVTGVGTVVFNSLSEFTGGLTVSDAATLRLGAGAQPGDGAVTMAVGTTLAVPGMETLSKPSINSLSITGGGTVRVRVNNGTELLDRRLPLATFATAPDAATLEALEIENPTSAANPYFYMDGDTLMLYAGDKTDGDVVDLNGETVSASPSGFSTFNGKIIENGTINMSGGHVSGATAGKYTIGNGAIVNDNTSGGPEFNGDWNFSVVDGGFYHQNVSSGNHRFIMPMRYGNSTFTLDNGVFVTDADKGSNNAEALTLGWVWAYNDDNDDNGKDKDVSMKSVLRNGSTLFVTNGSLRIGGARKKADIKANTLKVDFAVTNSTISVAGEIKLAVANGGWLNHPEDSYVKAIFGPGSDITCKQIYADGNNPSPAVTFDGATLHWNGGGASFIGHKEVGDIYTIDALGLTVDIPSGTLTCDQNATSLKGEGGITKIGAGTITWNQVSSKGSQGMTFTGPLVVSNGTWSSSLGYAASAFRVHGASSTLALSGALTNANVIFSATDGGTLTLAGATIPNDAAPDLTLASSGATDYFTRDGAATHALGTLALGEGAVLALTGGRVGVDAVSAHTLALSATAQNPVSLVFTDAANIPDGTYAILAITGGGEFTSGDKAKFALDVNLPVGASLSVSGASLLLTVRRDRIPTVAADASAAVVNAAVDGVGFVDAAVKVVIGGSAEEYNAFKTWADGVKGATGDALAGEAAVVANAHAAAAYLLGAERLLENEPTVEICGLSVGADATSASLPGGGVATQFGVSVSVKDGEREVAVDAAKVAAMFEATSDLGDWNGVAKLTPTVTTSGTDASGKMSFVVTPGDGTANRAFLRIRR